MSLTLLLNGQKKVIDLPDRPNLSMLIQNLNFLPDRVAIEQNGVIIPRLQWSETLLHEGDQIELVHFVGGG